MQEKSCILQNDTVQQILMLQGVGAEFDFGIDLTDEWALDDERNKGLHEIRPDTFNYQDMIRMNPRRKHVGTYVDDGFSGTNTERRPAFHLMMKDATAGKIDTI